MFDSNDDNLWEVPSIDVNAPVQAAVSAEEAVPAPEAETARRGRGCRACPGVDGGRGTR